MYFQRRKIPRWLPNFQISRGAVQDWLPSRGNILYTLVMIAILLWAQSAGAVPTRSNSAVSTDTIAYQGRLADSNGSPISSTLDMTFRLYSVATGGAALWIEERTEEVSDGLFNVMLGSVTPVPQSVITGNSNLFLGITIGTDGEMAPRVQLGSVPFAVQALTVPNASVTTAKLADGAVTVSKLSSEISFEPAYEGFSYFVNLLPKPVGWHSLVIDSLEFNTFPGSTFDSGIFSAPKNGYYRFRTHGFIGTGGTGSERIAIGILKNNTLHGMAGGNLSAGDTPGPSLSHVLYLQAGDTIQITSYTPIDVVFGGVYPWWFQGEFIGE